MITTWFKKNKGFFAITAVYVGICIVMLPLYNKAYLDDFAYAQTVRNFVNTGILKISDWTAVTLIFQVFWGALFSRIFGFSLASLQLSTIVLLYFGLVAFYFILREIQLDDTISALFTLALLSFP